jgi:murein DD-endopeptidase MepM/ murein hydrolase activator NlpD
MIENKDLYSFEPETDSTEETPESNSLEDSNYKFFTTILYQTIIAFTCLILLLTLSHSNFQWFQWAREKMHTAINASSENTFGKITNSKLWKTVIASTGNLVRLEEITKNQLTKENFIENSDVTVSTEKKQSRPSFQNSVWPVQGSIVKGYGWRYDAIRKTKEFQPGIEISALPDSAVLAVADGTITEIKHQPEVGWEIVISHNNEWSSNYFYLGPVQVKVGQKVKAGETIAFINRPDQDKGPILMLEIKEYDKPVDPLSILAS